MNHFNEFRKRVEAGPRIEYKATDGTWKEVYGHGCGSKEEAEAYCGRFGENFRMRPVEQPAEQGPLIQGEL